MRVAGRSRFLPCDELDARVPVSRRYVTGWFSPADHQLMVVFYERGSPIYFEAEVLRCGEVLIRFQGQDLAWLQNDIIDRYGGCIDVAKDEIRSRHPPPGLLEASTSIGKK